MDLVVVHELSWLSRLGAGEIHRFIQHCMERETAVESRPRETTDSSKLAPFRQGTPATAMQVICTDDTTFACEAYELTEYGVMVYSQPHGPTRIATRRRPTRWPTSRTIGCGTSSPTASYSSDIQLRDASDPDGLGPIIALDEEKVGQFIDQWLLDDGETIEVTIACSVLNATAALDGDVITFDRYDITTRSSWMWRRCR